MAMYSNNYGGTIRKYKNLSAKLCVKYKRNNVAMNGLYAIDKNIIRRCYEAS